ncbi:hypothetical protein LDO31_17920 [Luteimonas sp. XNQY3]|nr:hypothetical protein [Luteimonas sp. XNQY3]MCD9008077.1 hypothetical protein [Luteimonas sp. XNQY3]
MSKFDTEVQDTTGYFLPEDSQFRLKKLHAHMVFLSQLAQPRSHDEDESGWGPQITGDEIAVCLEMLAEQAERVLDEVTWPAEREVDKPRSQAREQADAQEAPAQVGEASTTDQPEGDEAAAAVAAQDNEVREDAPIEAQQGDAVAEPLRAGLPGEQGEAGDGANATDAEAPLVFGMTLDQLDAINRMHDRLRAYGDLVFGVERIDLANGTLSTLGDVIFEQAGAASDLMDEVADQCLSHDARRRHRVREEPAMYGAAFGPGLSRQATVPLPPPPVHPVWSQRAVTRH